MINLVNTISTYIKANIAGLTIYNDLFPKDDTTGVIAVHDPASRKTAEFIDGSAEKQINVSYTARYASAKKCREVLTAILDLLEGVKLTDTDDGYDLKISTVSNVQFLGTDDKNNTLYTCSVNVVYN